jgi:hypothetical protein
MRRSVENVKLIMGFRHFPLHGCSYPHGSGSPSFSDESTVFVYDSDSCKSSIAEGAQGGLPEEAGARPRSAPWYARFLDKESTVALWPGGLAGLSSRGIEERRGSDRHHSASAPPEDDISRRPSRAFAPPSDRACAPRKLSGFPRTLHTSYDAGERHASLGKLCRATHSFSSLAPNTPTQVQRSRKPLANLSPPTAMRT